jgi:hypothetical protein
MTYELTQQQRAKLARQCFTLARNYKTLADSLTKDFHDIKLAGFACLYDIHAECQYEEQVLGRYAGKDVGQEQLPNELETAYRTQLQDIKQLLRAVVKAEENNKEHCLENPERI